MQGMGASEGDAWKRLEETSDDPPKSNCIVEVFLPLFLLVTLICVIALFFYIGPTEMLRWMLSLVPKNPNIWHALLLYVVITVCIVCLIPLWPPLMIVSAIVFGFWYGFAIAYSAMVSGALISFLLGKCCFMRSFRDYVDNSDHVALRRMINVIERDGNQLKFLFLFRFLFIPIWLRNYAPSILEVSAWMFLLPVLVHSLWICTIFCMIGSATKDIAEVYASEGKKETEWDPSQLAIFSFALVAFALISWLAYSEYAKALAEEEERETEALLPKDTSDAAAAQRPAAV